MGAAERARNGMESSGEGKKEQLARGLTGTGDPQINSVQDSPDMSRPLLLRTIPTSRCAGTPPYRPEARAVGGDERGRRRMEDATSASVSQPSSATSFLRLLGLLKLPDADADADADPFPTRHLELDESDVVWSSPSEELSSSPSPSSYDDRDSVDCFSSPSPGLVRSSVPGSSFSPFGRFRRRPAPERCGLSAALAEDRLPLVLQRCTTESTTRPVEMPEGRAVEALVAGRVAHHQSAPVNVPVWPRWRNERKDDVLDGLEEEEGREDEEEEMVPPHVIVARSHVMTFSVFEGVGRTLKGRDLRRVRNAVLQKTGFLDV
ncbi:hypothetical protein C4D60_Mb04t24570 [Musa balbisiana]|uniref:Senescence regulator n=1 Tax=Musa balbisiana TaxID=52838 RepID=A0A4S8KEI4_MUSBA|nr:hypothetical protein C4D60_Mb04t24570 [Musa balbisiana]